MLNQIKDCFESVFGDYNDRKAFLASMKEKFKEIETKILATEKQEKEQASYGNTKPICNLNKTAFKIPEIEVPATLSVH